MSPKEWPSPYSSFRAFDLDRLPVIWLGFCPLLKLQQLILKHHLIRPNINFLVFSYSKENWQVYVELHYLEVNFGWCYLVLYYLKLAFTVNCTQDCKADRGITHTHSRPPRTSTNVSNFRKGQIKTPLHIFPLTLMSNHPVITNLLT